MPTDCDRSEKSIQLLLDGRLSAEQRRQLDRHLSECAMCSRALDDFRRVAAATSEWVRPGVADDPGEQFNAHVLATIGRETKTGATHLKPRKLRVLYPALAGVLILLGSLAVGYEYSAFLAQITPQPMGHPLLTPVSLAGAPAGILDTFARAADSLTALAEGVQSLHLPQWILETAAMALLVNVWFVRQAAIKREMECA